MQKQKQKPQQKTLKKSLKKTTLWNGYKYYESRAVRYGFARIRLQNYDKDYYN